MPMKVNADGTVSVRVVLTVTVDPHSYVVDVMEVDDANQKELRSHVKRTVRDVVRNHGMDSGVADCDAEGIYG